MRNFWGCVLLLFCQVVLAQKNELGKVTKQELLETKHKTDTSAVAAIIFKKARTTFYYTEKDGFSPTTTVEVKLKIYKKEGLKWANFKIPYYIGYKTLEDESVEIVNANTYNLENDKIVKTKVSGDGKFKQKKNEYWGVTSLTFPNVKAGSIIELEYKLKSPNISILPDFRFQYSIPVNYAEYESRVPEFYIYKGIRRGFVDLEIKQDLKSTAQSFQSKVDKTTVTQTMTFREIVTLYQAREVPPLIEEEFVNNIDNYYASLEQELQTIRYPDKEPKHLGSEWKDVAKSVYDDESFAKAIDQYDYFLGDVKNLLKDISGSEERTKKVFQYVRNRMSWNEKYGYFPDKDLPSAYNDKVGNVAEINLILLAMLKMAGIEVYPVLVSTRENGLAYFPNRTLFNYLIVSAAYDGKTVLLDATNKHLDFGVLPIRALNDIGRLIKKDGQTAEVNLMPTINSEKTTTVLAAVNANGEVSGKLRANYLNYHALLYRENYGKLAQESHVEKIEANYEGLEIEGFSIQNEDDLSKPIMENYSFRSTNSTELIGDKIYFSPLLFLAQTENPFKQDKREYPVDYKFPTRNKLSVSLTIPEGFTVESLPESKVLAMPDNVGNFRYSISNDGNKIQLLFTFDINQAVIGSDYYEALKNFYKESINKQTEKVVIKKA